VANNQLFWFRRDLRLDDNTALNELLENIKFDPKNSPQVVLPIFIFDTQILNQLKNPLDRRVQFILKTIQELKVQLQAQGTDLRVYHGNPVELIPQITQEFKIQSIYCNEDYDPYSRQRDSVVSDYCKKNGIQFLCFKDHVIFAKSEILNLKGLPYSIYTPYKKAWLEKFKTHFLTLKKSKLSEVQIASAFIKTAPIPLPPSLPKEYFEIGDFKFPEINVPKKTIENYHLTRDIPSLLDGTSHLGIHLRFGTISVRKLIEKSGFLNEVFLSELIWREFFMQILWHYPQVVKKSFRPEYENIKWRQSKEDFERWSQGQTGFPMIDAGIRELLATGHMHNRVRMLVASFFSKNLLHHWYQGERFFAEHLLDYELAANNGNWQWAAGCGCDAAPYFRIFNPETQRTKFDPQDLYISKWVPEWKTLRYPNPMIDLKQSHHRALEVYKAGLGK
jgi:deoxyribodipyrimidine photo-lyase